MSAFDILTVVDGKRTRKTSDQNDWDFQSVRVGTSLIPITEDSGALDFGGVVLKNISDPPANEDGATKLYVDRKAGNYAYDPKESVRAATTQEMQSESALPGQVLAPIGFTYGATALLSAVSEEYGQSILVAGSDWDITNITFEANIYNIDFIAGDISAVCEIYAVSGGLPTGASLATSTNTFFVFMGPFASLFNQTLSFDFASPTLTAGTDYVIAVRISAMNGLMQLDLKVDLTNPYAGGSADKWNPAGANPWQLQPGATSWDLEFSVTYDTTVSTGAAYNASGGTAGTGAFTGAPTVVDGVTLADDNRVLVKDQTDLKQNGIYKVVSAAGQTWERAADQDGAPGAEVSSGNHTYVEQGSVWVHTDWTLKGDGIITLNTHDLDWGQTGGGAAIAGAGLYKSATDTMDAGAGSGVTVNADDIDVNVSQNGIWLSSNKVSIFNLHDSLGLTNADAASVEAGEILVRGIADHTSVYKAIGTSALLDNYLNILICQEPSPVANSGTVDKAAQFVIAGDPYTVKTDSSTVFTWASGDPVYVSRAEAGRATNVDTAFVPGDRFVRIGTCVGDEVEPLGSEIISVDVAGENWGWAPANPVGQGITLASTTLVDRVQWKMLKGGGMTGSVECVVYADSGGFPTGGILHTSAPVDVDDILQSVYSWITFDFAGVNLSAGSYVLVLQPVSADPFTGNTLVQNYTSSGNVYAGGQFLRYSSGWGAVNFGASDADIKVFESDGTLVPILFAPEETIVW